jgi:anti-sigma B factor antagonist
VAAPFAIRESSGLGVAHVYVSGEVDLAARSTLRGRVGTQLTDHAIKRVVIDLSGVTFLDSSGIGALVGCRRLADENGKVLEVTGAQGQVKAVLDLTGVSGMLAGPSSADA